VESKCWKCPSSLLSLQTPESKALTKKINLKLREAEELGKQYRARESTLV